jgi:hypothetical protein
VLSVEVLVAAVILAVSLLSHQFFTAGIGRQQQATTALPSGLATASPVTLPLADTTIVILAALASYVGLAF